MTVFFTVLKNTIVFAVVTGPLGYILFILLCVADKRYGKNIKAAVYVFLLCAYTSGFDIYGMELLIQQQPVWIFKWNAYELRSYKRAGKMVERPNDSNVCYYNCSVMAELRHGIPCVYSWIPEHGQELFEAGAIDGIRNRWQELRYITIPQMAPQLMFSAVMQISATFAVGDIIMMLAGSPTTNYAADVLVTYMKDLSTVRFELGYACTVATFLFILMIVLNNIITTVLRKYSTD